MALNECTEKIAGHVVKNCINPIVKGVKAQGWLFMSEDVTRLGIDFFGTSIGDNFVKPGKKGYKLGNIENLVTTKVDGMYENTYEKVVTAALLDDGVNVAKIIEALADRDARFVVVLEHKNKTFEIIGLENPMSTNGQEVVNDKSSDDTRGGWSFGLVTQESRVRYIWDDGNYLTTKGLFDSLGNPAT